MTTSEHILHQVQAAFALLFPDEVIGPESDFFALGGDSQALVGLCCALEEKLGREVHPTLVLYAPSVVDLATALADVGAEARN